MGKRKVDDDNSDIDISSTESEGEAEAEEVVNVDFDYFDLNPEVDFHAIKNLLRQLFGDDNVKFDISSIADLILTRTSVGSTIKTEGKEGDPLAFLAVVNVNENQKKLRAITDYVLEMTKKQVQFNLFLRKLFKESKVGLVFSERMINMPVEVVPPMYKMLHEEIEKANSANEHFEFDYFLVVSKKYKLVKSEIDDDDSKKKKKKIQGDAPEEFDYFHYEDLVLEEKARFFGHFPYENVNQETDSRRVFTQYGIDPQLSLLLLTKDAMAQSVPLMEEKFPPF